MSAEPGSVAWVVGGGGLLGGTVLAEAARGGHATHRSRVPWGDPEAALAALTADAERLLGAYDDVDLLWCAGAGVVATPQEALRREVDLVRAFVEVLVRCHAARPSTTLRVFLASSAGGVHAGSEHPPFTERTPPRPISPYGEAKLAIEEAMLALTGSGVSVLVGRIANLYGPGQDLTKPQGLITQLCRSRWLRSPLLMYVSLDTARDYVYVRDAAKMVLAGQRRLAEEPAGTGQVKILASQAPVTLATVIGTLNRVTKGRAPIVLGTSPHARFQTRDLRFRSTVWPELDHLASTPLAEGIASTFADVASSMRAPVMAR
jgi:UDP-glucose 4-epimerase